MVNNLTSFVSYSEVDVRGVDLLDDAWGFSQQFSEVLKTLSLAAPLAPDSLIDELLCRVSECRDPDSDTLRKRGSDDGSED